MTFSEQQILEYVTLHPDGFDYAQLQTGVGRFELIEMMLKHGFEMCDFCLEDWGIHECPATLQPACFACMENLRDNNLWGND